MCQASFAALLFALSTAGHQGTAKEQVWLQEMHVFVSLPCSTKPRTLLTDMDLEHLWHQWGLVV